MLESFFILLGILINLLLYNKLYFFFFKENIIFIKYFKYFLFFTILEILFLNYFKIFHILNLETNYIQSYFISNFLLFFVIFFNICTKSYESPTYLIHKFIKKKKKRYSKIINYLKKERIIEIRIDDLIKQKLILKKKNVISLSSNGNKFATFYLFIKKFFNLKTEG